jgi:hypothetical protein
MTKQYRYGKQTATVTSANGSNGILIRSLDKQYYFRVYQNDGEFVDYELRHFDLGVIIQERDAAFYTIGEHHILDHAPETLGLEAVSESTIDSTDRDGY